MTEWKYVPGFEGAYIVSDEGDVVSLPRNIRSKGDGIRPLNGRTLKKHVLNNGYEQVTLCRDGDVKRMSVHRIVAEAFMPDHEGDQVNHINGIKTDNRVENLEWCTCIENHKHAFAHGLRPARPRTSKAVMRSDGKVFPSLSAAAKDIKASRGSIFQQIHGKRSHVHGYQFEFVDD